MNSFNNVFIKNKFYFLPNIGFKKEEKIISFLKQKNCNSNFWNCFLKQKNIPGLSFKKKHSYDNILLFLERKLLEEDFEIFKILLEVKDHYLLYDYFKEKLIFLDIETYGYDKNKNITFIGLSDGNEFKLFNPNNLSFDIKKVLYGKMIVTFNGNVFDIPHIKKKLNYNFENNFFIDLRFLLQKLNFKGSLNKVEKKFGIKRNNNIVLSSGDPLLLYKKFFATQDFYYLELLEEYIRQDVESLIILLPKIITLLKEKT